MKRAEEGRIKSGLHRLFGRSSGSRDQYTRATSPSSEVALLHPSSREETPPIPPQEEEALQTTVTPAIRSPYEALISSEETLSAESSSLPQTQGDPQGVGSSAAVPVPLLRVSGPQDTGHTARRGLKSSLERVQQSIVPAFPFLGKSVIRLLALSDEAEEVIQLTGSREQLRESLEEATSHLQAYMAVSGMSESMRRRLEGTVNKLREQLDCLSTNIDEWQNRSPASKLSRNQEATRSFEEIMRLVKEIWTAFERETLMDVDKKVDTSAAALQQVQEDAKLSKLLRPVERALIFRDKDKGCWKGTRVSVLQHMLEWSTNPTSSPVFWLNGMAGTGKSSIIYSLCKTLSDAHLLGASFFCSRQGDAAQGDVFRIIPTLAYRMAQNHPPFRSALLNELNRLEIDTDPPSLPVDEQFRILLEIPLIVAFKSDKRKHILIIDGLDECCDSETVESFLDVVLELQIQLPIRFILTSRREEWLETRFASSDTIHHRAVRLDEAYRSSTPGDIRLYLREKLSSPVARRRLASSETVWPSQSELDRLVELSDQLFVYASTVVNYLLDKRPNPAERLEKLLQAQAQRATRGLDAIYHFILSEALEPLETWESSIVVRCLGALVCARQELSISEIAELLDITPTQVQTAFKGLHSVITTPPNNADALPVSIFHATFQDYITAEDHADRPWHIDVPHFDRELANECLRLMAKLEFNITQTESSYDVEWWDEPDLTDNNSMEEHAPDNNSIDDDSMDVDNQSNDNFRVSRALQYACLYFVHHLSDSTPDEAVLEQVGILFQQKFLYWLEVLCDLQDISPHFRAAPRAASILDSLMRLLQEMERPQVNRSQVPAPQQPGSPQFLHSRFLKDAIQFVNAFHTPISTIPAHIYISALPFTDPNSLIAQRFWPLFRNTLQVKTKAVRRQQPSMILNPYAGPVRSITFSPNGSLIASGARDGTVRVLHVVRADEDVYPPLRGHLHPVKSVAFSPNGRFIVSSSEDQTIRLWDVEKREAAPYLFEGHRGSVNSVAFSPDGTRIVSGSDDHTLRMWDVGTGRQVQPSLEGHSASVYSVAFSPDGSRIVSGSANGAIWMWDVRTRVGTHFATYSASMINSIAFSPDGRQLVSGSFDGTLRVSDVETGVVISPTFWAHNAGSVSSVAFSSDGNLVASGSQDRKVCIWDIRTGQLACPALQGHTSFVNFVVFTPDGRRIASGSEDGTIRVWDVRLDEESDPAEDGHTDVVNSVSFSPDGTLIVSASWDNTARFWNAITGMEVYPGPTMEDDERVVDSIVFSHDGQSIVLGSRHSMIVWWELRTGRRVELDLKGIMNRLRRVAFSPHANCLLFAISGREDHSIQVFWTSRILNPDQVVNQPAPNWVVNRGCISLQGHTDVVTSLAFSPDGQRMVAGAEDGTIRFWGVTSPQPYLVIEGDMGAINSITFSPNGALIASSGTDVDTVRVWNTQTGAEVYPALEGHTGGVYPIVFSPDGTYVVTGAADSSIRVWDARTGKEACSPLWGHADAVESLAFSRDGARLVSGSHDHTIRVWDFAKLRRELSAGRTSAFNNGEAAEDRMEVDNSAGDPGPSTSQSFTPGPPEDPHPATGGETSPVENGALVMNNQYISLSSEMSGWVLAGQHTPLFHVPHELRAGFVWPGMGLVIGGSQCRVDLSRFVHGKDWARCYTG